jgi:hypothetical protein
MLSSYNSNPDLDASERFLDDLMRRGEGMASLGWLGWKERMRAVLVMAFALLAAERCLLGVFEGVGSIVMGSMVGAREVDFDEEGPAVPSESEVAVVKFFREYLRGVLFRFTRCLGDAGEEGGLDS